MKTLDEWIEHNKLEALFRAFECHIQYASKEWAPRGCMISLREHARDNGLWEEPKD
jgi:hypothetical protein